MGELIRMVFTLTLLSAISGGVLAGVQQWTKEPIERQQLAHEKAPVIASILRDAENDPIADRFTLTRDGVQHQLFPGLSPQGRVIVIEGADKGFSGDIRVLVGIRLEDDSLAGVGVTTQSETPGIGSRAKEDPAFTRQFAGIGVRDPKTLRQDGGEIDGLSGATITSRAVCRAVENASAAYLRIKPDLETRFSGKEE